MWTTRARSVLSVALLGAAATLGSVGSAHAAVYSGNWDPAYGPAFPQLGWHASGLFNVPDACLALGTANDHLIDGACAGFKILSAEVEFYNVGAPSTILETFALDPSVPVASIDIAGGKLSGIDTSFFHFFVPTGPSMGIAGGGAYSFSLILFNDKAQLAYANPPGTSPFCVTVPVGDSKCGLSLNVPTAVFAPVPEPETYALLLAGFGALSFAARRRRRG